MNHLDASALIRAGRSVDEPFQLIINLSGNGDVVLVVKKILRLLPGKRIVAVASVEERDYLVKIFIGRFAWRL